MVKVVLALAVMLVGRSAWAHGPCGIYQTPETGHCTAERHEHVEVFDRGGAGNSDTTLVIDGPAVERTPILHHDSPHSAPSLMYFFRITGEVPVSSANPGYAGRLYISLSSGDGSYRLRNHGLANGPPAALLFGAPEDGSTTLNIDYGIAVDGGAGDGADPTPFTIRVWWTLESAPEQELEPEPEPVSKGLLQATLLNLSPLQSWVHLYCREGACRVTFACNGMEGEPVTWTVDVEPKTIFSYWPNKTADEGTPADLQAALIAAGKTEAEARRRTTCEVFSDGDLAVRGYTLFGGQPTLIPVAIY